MSEHRRVDYRYDALDRLIEARYSDGTVVRYAYDPAGNRTAAVVTPAAASGADQVESNSNGGSIE